MGIWHALKTTEEWKIQIATLYSVVNDGLGNELANNIAYNLLQQSSFTSGATLKQALFPIDEDSTVDVKACEAIYNDKHYGLSNPDNVEKWAVICGDDEADSEAFLIELFTYFGIRHRS